MVELVYVPTLVAGVNVEEVAKMSATAVIRGTATVTTGVLVTTLMRLAAATMEGPNAAAMKYANATPVVGRLQCMSDLCK